jgi:ankyrin repeat protein
VFERGRMDDVQLFVNLYPFHKYITNRRVNGSTGMTLKEMVNQVGRNSCGNEFTPLMSAAAKEHLNIVQYLIEQGEADPNIATSDGYNALHYEANFNIKNTDLIQLLLNHMSIDSINKKQFGGYTPLDCAYVHNNHPIRQEIIDLLRSKGGKSARELYDENGNEVEEGEGDLNDY